MGREIERTRLQRLDQWRDETLMRSGAGITAMIVMIRELMERLDERTTLFSRDECEQLAWLLNGQAYAFPITDDGPCLDQYPHPYPIHQLIGQARKRPKGKRVPRGLVQVAKARIRELMHLRRVCEEPYTDEAWERKQTGSLLLSAADMDRLIRYEVHADRTLTRCLETLAKLRGATVETVAASLRGVTPDGAAVEVRGQRTRWQPGQALAG